MTYVYETTNPDKPGTFHTEWMESGDKPTEKPAEPKPATKRHVAE